MGSGKILTGVFGLVTGKGVYEKGKWVTLIIQGDLFPAGLFD